MRIQVIAAIEERVRLAREVREGRRSRPVRLGLAALRSVGRLVGVTFEAVDTEAAERLVAQRLAGHERALRDPGRFVTHAAFARYRGRHGLPTRRREVPRDPERAPFAILERGYWWSR